MCSYGLLGRIFDDTERIACAVHAILALKQSPKLVVNCFLKAGLLAGYKDLHRHFPTSLFISGIPMRDVRLPQTNTACEREVLSLRNIYANPGSPVTIRNEMVSHQYIALEECKSAQKGFKKFFFFIGTTAENRQDPVEEEQVCSTLIHCESRKLFKLSNTNVIARGAPGRFPKAYGAISSAKEQYNVAVRAENSAIRPAIEKKKRESERILAATREEPLLITMKEGCYIASGDKLTKKALLTMLSAKKDSQKSLGISLNFPRDKIVNILLKQSNIAP